MNFEQTIIEKQNQRVKVTMRCKAMPSTTTRPSTMLFTDTIEAKPNEGNLEGSHHNTKKKESMANYNAVALLVMRNRRVKVAMRCETMLSRAMRSSTMRFTKTTEGKQTELPLEKFAHEVKIRRGGASTHGSHQE